MRLGFGADFQLPEQHDPFGGQLDVGFIREAQFALDGQTVQRRRTHVEDHVLATFNGDIVACAGHVSVWPGGRIRPEGLLERRRLPFLGQHDSEYAAEKDQWKERPNKE